MIKGILLLLERTSPTLRVIHKEKENNITLASEVKKYQGLNESLTHDKRVQSDALASLQTRVEILLEEKTLALADSESRLLL